MPEALAVLVVAFVAVVIYVAMWVQSRNPAFYNPVREQARLEQHVKWLEERLAVARDEEWGDEMVASLKADHTASVEQLVQIKLRLAAANPANRGQLDQL